MEPSTSEKQPQTPNRRPVGAKEVVKLDQHVVEIISESELAGQPQQGGAGPAPGSRSNVPLPPMEPLPAAGSPQGGGAVTTPVR